jgi:ABC-2 type transport system ATP-binding protein
MPFPPAASASAIDRRGRCASATWCFTVADHLRFGAGLNLRFDRQLAERRLAALDIPLDRKAGALSGGQQSQVALALALAKRPELLVLDEPLSSLDPLARREFLQTLMGAVAQEGITVLFSSHVVHELERVCDHLACSTTAASPSTVRSRHCLHGTGS